MEPNKNYLAEIEKFFDKYLKCSYNCEFVLCWSGGRDSTALLFLLSEFKKKQPITLKVIMVPYPKATINYEGLEKTNSYWQERGIKLDILDHQYQDPKNLATLKVCQECKRIRRLVLTRDFFSKSNLENTTIITGHNSWDLAAYLVEMVIAEMTDTHKADEVKIKERYLEVTNKFFPYYSVNGGPTIIRPFINFDDNDVENIIERYNIPYPFPFIPHKCPWLEQRKRILQKYFKTMNLNLNSEKIIHFAQKTFKLPDKEEFDRLPFQIYIL